MRASRFLRFRLRTLFAVIAILSLPLVWYSTSARQLAAETRALEEIGRDSLMGQIATLDDGFVLTCQYPGGTATRRWFGPEWLRVPVGWCNADLLYRVEKVHLYSASFDDKVVEPLTRLRHLREISLRGTSVTLTGLERLKNAFPEALVEYDPTVVSDFVPLDQ